MPKSLSSNLYGADDTGMASSIASDALGTAGTGVGSINQSDYWGATKDDDAMAKGNTPEYEDYDVDIIRKTNAGGGDRESLTNPYPQLQRFPRHTPGPKTSTDKGGGVTDPPPSRQTSKSPGKYSDF